MAQTGYTPILIYSSSTASNTPAVGNLTNSTLGSELAINITDGKLFYKDNANAIQVIGWKVTPTTAGGTGLTSYTAGDMLYYASGTTLSKLAIGATGRYLSSSGTAPQWTAPAALTKTDDTNVTLTLGGSASTALLNAASLTLGWTGQLAVSRGGTGVSTSTGTGSVVLSSTPSFGTTIGVGGATAAASGAGITFPATQSASSDANTLDDYEEGTWTPTLIGSSSNPTVTYSYQRGTYVKIGSLVSVSCQLGWSANSGGSGYAQIGGFPFTPSMNSNDWSSGAVSETGVNMTWGSGYTQVAIEVKNGSALAAVTQMGSTKDQAVFAPSAMGSSGYLIFQCTYKAT